MKFVRGSDQVSRYLFEIKPFNPPILLGILGISVVSRRLGGGGG